MNERPRVIVMQRKHGYGPYSVFPLVQSGRWMTTGASLAHGTKAECESFASGYTRIGDVWIEPICRGTLFDFEARLTRAVEDAD